MGMYDGPDFEKPRYVSIWVAITPLRQIPKTYFEENYGGDDEDPFNAFSSDFGFGYYNHDEVDTNASKGKAKPVEELIGECSFSSSYVTEAASEAKRRGLEKTEFVFHLYNFKYQPAVTGITKSRHMEFLGSFRYSSKAPSAIQREAE